MARSPSPYTARAVVATEQRARAIKLRGQGMSFAEVADAMDLKTASAAQRLVVAALADFRPENIEDERALQVARIDMAVAKLWTRADMGDVDALDKIRGWEQMRVKILGLEAPTRTHATVEVDARAEVKIEVVEMTKQYMDLVAEIVEDEVEAIPARQRAIEAASVVLNEGIDPLGDVDDRPVQEAVQHPSAGEVSNVVAMHPDA